MIDFHVEKEKGGHENAIRPGTERDDPCAAASGFSLFSGRYSADARCVAVEVEIVQSDVFRMQSDVTSVELIGVLDRVAVPDARRTLIDIVRRSRTRYLDVNLRGVSSLDTAGVALLVELLSDLSRRGKELRLLHLNRPVKEMIQLARLDRFLDPGSSEDEK